MVTKKVNCYVNNQFNGYAVENALWLIEKLDLSNEIQQKTLITGKENLAKSQFQSNTGVPCKNWNSEGIMGSLSYETGPPIKTRYITGSS